MEEVSRQVIIDAKKEGVDQLFLTDPMLFSTKILNSRITQFNDAETTKGTPVFYDRAMPDVTAYMDFIRAEYSSTFEQPCFENQYDFIFLLPPWKAIYTQDSERYETFDQAKIIHEALLNSYKKYGYNIVIVPEGTLEERTHFILKNATISI